MATGELIGAIAMTEPGTGSDLQGVRTSARATATTTSSTAPNLHHQWPARQSRHRRRQDRSREGAKGISLFVVETDEAEGFRRGRNLDKIGQHAQDTSELFFDDVRVPTANLLGDEEGRASVS